MQSTSWEEHKASALVSNSVFAMFVYYVWLYTLQARVWIALYVYSRPVWRHPTPIVHTRDLKSTASIWLTQCSHQQGDGFSFWKVFSMLPLLYSHFLSFHVFQQSQLFSHRKKRHDFLNDWRLSVAMRSRASRANLGSATYLTGKRGSI